MHHVGKIFGTFGLTLAFDSIPQIITMHSIMKMYYFLFLFTLSNANIYNNLDVIWK